MDKQIHNFLWKGGKPPNNKNYSTMVGEKVKLLPSKGAMGITYSKTMKTKQWVPNYMKPHKQRNNVVERGDHQNVFIGKGHIKLIFKDLPWRVSIFT